MKRILLAILVAMPFVAGCGKKSTSKPKHKMTAKAPAPVKADVKKALQKK